MFAYVSSLVELGYFDVMEMNFLIVGHTHSSIDQYFSVLSKAITNAEWIGSPLSLQALCNQAHKPTRGEQDEIIERRPSVNRQIEVYYDVVSALKPYINDKIKFFQVPHSFLFKKVCGKCIMQYKLFSSNAKYLPLEPNDVATPESIFHSTNIIEELPLKPLSIINGPESFFEHMGIPKESKSSYIFNNEAITKKVYAARNMISEFEQLEVNALHQLEVRTELEEAEGHSIDHRDKCMADANPHERLSIQKYLATQSTRERGYIMWLIEDPSLPPLSSLRPMIIDTTIGIVPTNCSTKRTSSATSASRRLQPLVSSQGGAQQIISEATNDEEVEIDEDGEVDVEFVSDGANAQVVADLRIEDGKVSSSQKATQLSRAKKIVKVATDALSIITPSTSYSHVAYTFDRNTVEFNGEY